MSTLYVKGNTPIRNPQRKDKTMANEALISGNRIADAKAVRKEIIKAYEILDTIVWRKVLAVRNDADRENLRKVFIKERDNFATKTLSAISDIIRDANA